MPVDKENSTEDFPCLAPQVPTRPTAAKPVKNAPSSKQQLLKVRSQPAKGGWASIVKSGAAFNLPPPAQGAAWGSAASPSMPQLSDSMNAIALEKSRAPESSPAPATSGPLPAAASAALLPPPLPLATSTGSVSAPVVTIEAVAPPPLARRILTAADVLRSGGLPAAAPPVPIPCAPSPAAVASDLSPSSEDEDDDRELRLLAPASCADEEPVALVRSRSRSAQSSSSSAAVSRPISPMLLTSQAASQAASQAPSPMEASPVGSPSHGAREAPPPEPPMLQRSGTLTLCAPLPPLSLPDVVGADVPEVILRPKPGKLQPPPPPTTRASPPVTPTEEGCSPPPALTAASSMNDLDEHDAREAVAEKDGGAQDGAIVVEAVAAIAAVVSEDSAQSAISAASTAEAVEAAEAPSAQPKRADATKPKRNSAFKSELSVDVSVADEARAAEELRTAKPQQPAASHLGGRPKPAQQSQQQSQQPPQQQPPQQPPQQWPARAQTPPAATEASSKPQRQSPCKRAVDKRGTSPFDARDQQQQPPPQQQQLRKQGNKKLKGGSREPHGPVLRAGPPLAPTNPMALPTPPPPCLFDGEVCPVPQPSAAAIEALDRAIGEFYRTAREESTAFDGPACSLMAHVQQTVAALWGPYARVSCFGSRATGLACATSDIDLVVTGVPGIDAATMRPAGRWQQPPPPVTMDAQVMALEDLLPRIKALPGVLTATINRSAVPVIAITADVPTIMKVAAEYAEAERRSVAAKAAAAGGEVTPEEPAHNAPEASGAEAASKAEAAAAAAPAEGKPAPTSTLLHLDISLHSEKHRGLIAAQHIRWLHAHLLPLAPLCVFLKALLHRHQLKSTFTGGLSSYALVVMVARFLIDRQLLQYTRWAPKMAPKGGRARSEPGAIARAQAEAAAVERVVAEAEANLGLQTPSSEVAAADGAADAADAADAAATEPAAAEPSLGLLLVEVLGFYGHVFDPKQHALLGGTGMGVIPPAGCGFAERERLAPLLCMASAYGMQYPLHADPFAMQPLVCVDPVDPTNNMAKSCYRIAAVQRLFAASANTAVAAAEKAASALDASGAKAHSISVGFCSAIGADPSTLLAATEQDTAGGTALTEAILGGSAEATDRAVLPPRPASA